MRRFWGFAIRSLKKSCASKRRFRPIWRDFRRCYARFDGIRRALEAVSALIDFLRLKNRATDTYLEQLWGADSACTSRTATCSRGWFDGYHFTDRHVAGRRPVTLPDGNPQISDAPQGRGIHARQGLAGA